MKLSTHRAEFFLDLMRLVRFANSLGFKVAMGEVKRTEEQQKIYFQSGRSKTMKSNHLRGLAADPEFYKVIDGKEEWINGLKPELALEILSPLGAYWENLNLLNRWGGNFDKDWNQEDPWVDVPHFERNV